MLAHSPFMINSNKFVLICALVFLLMPFSLPAQSDTQNQLPDASIQSLDAIAMAVDEFIRSENQLEGREVSVATKPLDRRMRLARCDEPLDAVWSPGSRQLGRVAVQVACTSPKRWRIHVQATITMEGSVWTLARGAKRGEILKPHMLTKKVISLGTQNSALITVGSPITDITPWLGYMFSQRVNTGQVLNERMLEPANLIKKGDIVLITHRSQGLSLQTKGIALKDAAANQQVQVKNSASGKVIDAIAVAEGIVEIL